MWMTDYSRQLDGTLAERSRRRLDVQLAGDGVRCRHRVRCCPCTHDDHFPLLPPCVWIASTSKDPGRASLAEASRQRDPRCPVETGGRRVRVPLERSYRVASRQSYQKLPPNVDQNWHSASSSALLRRRPVSPK